MTDRVDAKAVLEGSERTKPERLSKHILKTARAKWKPSPPASIEECDALWLSWVEHEAVEVEVLEDALSQTLADLDTLETDAAPFAAQIAQRKTYTITKDRTYTLANGEMDEMTPWVGKANDVRIRARALTAQEIADRSTRTPVPDQMDAKAMADYRGALLDSLRTVASHLVRERRLRPIQTTNSYENACIDSFIANINVVADIMFLPVRLDAAEKVARIARADNMAFLSYDEEHKDETCAGIHRAVVSTCDDILAALAGEGKP